MNRIVPLFLAAVVPLACGGKKPPAPPPPPEVAALELPSDPGKAVSVIEAVAAGPKDEIVVVGRVRGIVPGSVSFQLTDASLHYCGSGNDPMENCPHPWDYCCLDQGDVNAKTLVVEARDAGGMPLAATSLPGLRLLDLVAVRGKLTKDEHGVVVVETTGWFRRERPELPDDLQWPE